MDHRPRRHRWPSLLISIIVKITAQCTSMLDAREWLPRLVSSGPICYPICPPSRPIPFHPIASQSSIHPSIYPSKPEVYAPEGPGSNGIKNTHRNVWGAAADGISHPVGLFIVSGLNSEACLNSEMNLWINTIMVIWHPLWVAATFSLRCLSPYRVCRPAHSTSLHSTLPTASLWDNLKAMSMFELDLVI